MQVLFIDIAFSYVFHVFILTLEAWSRQRRQARPKTTAVAGTCKHEIIILVASASAHLLNARVVKHFIYNAPALSALPVHLLRQVSKQVVFLLNFSMVLLERLWGSPGGIWTPFRFSRGPFWSHFLHF